MLYCTGHVNMTHNLVSVVIAFVHCPRDIVVNHSVLECPMFYKLAFCVIRFMKLRFHVRSHYSANVII